jgi:hypothetical protein
MWSELAGSPPRPEAANSRWTQAASEDFPLSFETLPKAKEQAWISRSAAQAFAKNRFCFSSAAAA